MDFVEREQLVVRYRDGYRAVTAALGGATDPELDRRPAAGAWTAREVVHHLADSETTSYLRLRMLLAEDQPVLAAYDEERFAERLHYDRPIDPSLEVFRSVRVASAQLLQSLDGHEWGRSGVHSESGRYDVATWLRIYADHGHAHAAQIARARQGEA
jgi:hypothetical protein